MRGVGGGGGGGLNTGYFKILKIWKKDPKFVQDLIGEGGELDLTLYYNYAFGYSLKKNY